MPSSAPAANRWGAVKGRPHPDEIFPTRDHVRAGEDLLGEPANAILPKFSATGQTARTHPNAGAVGKSDNRLFMPDQYLAVFVLGGFCQHVGQREIDQDGILLLARVDQVVNNACCQVGGQMLVTQQ